MPASYLDDGHLDHGYAMTVHRAQGATVDRAFVLGSDTVDRGWGYTAMSRHRHEARLYVTAGPEFLNQARLPLAHAEEVAQRVADGFRNRHTKQLAMLQGEIAENNYRARQWERDEPPRPGGDASSAALSRSA